MGIGYQVKIVGQKWQPKGDNDKRQYQSLVPNFQFSVIDQAAAPCDQQKSEKVLREEVQAKELYRKLVKAKCQS